MPITQLWLLTVLKVYLQQLLKDIHYRQLDRSSDKHRKTNAMVINCNPNQFTNVTIDRSLVAKVSKFRKLGSWVSKDLNPDIEIRACMEMARTY